MELDLFRDSVIDPDKETNGVWKPLQRGVEVKIARVNSPEYRRVLRRKVKPLRATLDMDDDTAAEVSDELMQEVYAKTILKDLRVGENVTLKIDGEKYVNGSFNYAMALKLLKNQLFRDKIKALAEDDASFLLYGDEAAGKDSAQP